MDAITADPALVAAAMVWALHLAYDRALAHGKPAAVARARARLLDGVVKFAATVPTTRDGVEEKVSAVEQSLAALEDEGVLMWDAPLMLRRALDKLRSGKPDAVPALRLAADLVAVLLASDHVRGLMTTRRKALFCQHLETALRGLSRLVAKRRGKHGQRVAVIVSGASRGEVLRTVGEQATTRRRARQRP